MTTIKERNSNNEIELRRNCDRLISIGNGIIAFAVWTVVKMIGLYLYNKQAVLKYIGADLPYTDPADKALFTNLAVAFFTFFMLIAVLIQMYTGASAIAVGRGRSKKKRRMYLVFGTIMLISSAASVAQVIRAMFTGQSDDTPEIFKRSIIVELTWLILLFEMIYSSVKIKKLSSYGKHFKAE